MKTTNNLTLITAVLCSLGALTACQTKTEPISGVANPPVAQPANTAKPSGEIKAERANPAVPSLASPTAAYQTAYAARQTKDVNGLKKTLSKKMLGFFTDMGKDEHKTLDDELKELAAQPQAATAAVRNEKITGDKATLEYTDEKGQWKTMDFVKEGSDWKMTLPNAQPTIIQDTKH